MPHYAQWFPGKENSIADALSRDFHLTNTDLTSKLFELFSPQLTSSFQIIPLPEAITTCVGNLLRLLPKTQQLLTEPVPSAVAAGSGTWASLTPSATATIRTSTASTELNRSTCSPVSQLPSGKGCWSPRTPDALVDLALDGRQAQFVPPSTVWHRPFGLTNLAARYTTQEADSNPFWPPS